MPVLEVKAIEPAALSPDGAGEYLSLTKRQIYNLIADGFLIAKRSGARTLVDFASVKSYYEGLPLKTVAASIPNSPQCTAPARRRRRRVPTLQAEDVSDPAVGEIMPASVRALMIAACWRRRLGALDQQALVNAPDKAPVNTAS
jgi:excisionase family DNA binding protein